MPVTVKNKNKTLYFFIKGEIDHHTAPAIREAIDDGILMFENSEIVVLDFSGVTFMDSSGVGLVMGRYRIIASKNKHLKIENLSERDYKIMKMSGIEKLAEISKKEN
jgi:stage II sporulation protein AA (anti-sigma F factor antagonist)